MITTFKKKEVKLKFLTSKKKNLGTTRFYSLDPIILKYPTPLNYWHLNQIDIIIKIIGYAIFVILQVLMECLTKGPF